MFFIPYGTREKIPRRHFPIVTVLLVVANTFVFLWEMYLLSSQGEVAFNTFIDRFAFIPTQLSQGVLPLGILTALFLHAGLLHIVGNMLYLLPFGDNVEDRLGRFRYVVFYLLCGVTANLVFAAFNPHSTVPLLGASGAIAGVLGGYLALNPRGSRVRGIFLLIIIPLQVELPAILFIGYWFVMQVFSSVASLSVVGSQQAGGVAFLAHVGGFITGLILAPLLAVSQRASPTENETV